MSGLPGVVVQHHASLKADQQDSAFALDLVSLPKMVERLVTARTLGNPVLDCLARLITVQCTSSGRIGPSGALVQPLVEMAFPPE